MTDSTWHDVPVGPIHAWRRGSGPRTLVFLHGGPGLSDYLESLADEVADALDDTWTMVRFQQRGLAPSTLEGPFDMVTAIDDVRAVVAATGAGRATLVGHSWGGHLALHVALAAPELVDALVIIDPLGAVDGGGGDVLITTVASRVGDERAAEAFGLMEQGELAAGFALLWPGYFSSIEVAPPAPDIGFGAEPSAGLSQAIGEHFAAGTLEHGLGRFRGRALFVLGRESPIPFSHGERTAQLMNVADNAVDVLVLPTGHFPWLEQPGVVGSEIAAFLAD